VFGYGGSHVAVKSGRRKGDTVAFVVAEDGPELGVGDARSDDDGS
jgi:hypothetical protein